MSHGYAMLPRYRGVPVCRCGTCRRCNNREAAHRYNEKRREAQHADEDARMDAIIQAEQGRKDEERI